MDLGFTWLVEKAVHLSLFWLIIVVFFFSSIIIGLFILYCSILTTTLFLVPPNKKIGGVIYSILAGIFCVMALISYWDIETSIIGKIIIELQVLIFWVSMIKIGFISNNEE